MHILQKYQGLIGKASQRLDWFGPLFARVVLGIEFAGTGWGKLHSHEKVTAYFADLGLPAASANAWMAAGTEFVGGVLLVVGLATRFWSLALAVIMLVAIYTAKRAEISDIFDLVALVELAYFALLVWLAAQGPGRASLDALIAPRYAHPSKQMDKSDA